MTPAFSGRMMPPRLTHNGTPLVLVKDESSLGRNAGRLEREQASVSPLKTKPAEPSGLLFQK